MTGEELCSLYDEDYAASYDASYLLGERFIECTTFECVLLSELLQTRHSWIDVACGTGYFLSRFTNVRRAGLDLSPAMLARARRANPDVPFYQLDFRNSALEWAGQWELVTCMWYAYCYAGSLDGVQRVLRNLVEWTAPAGACFLPFCDPAVLCKLEIPDKPPPDSDDGNLRVTGVAWEWVDQPSGRRHRDMFAPQLPIVLELFEPYFNELQVLRYPAFHNDCMKSRSAILATGRNARS